MEKWRKFSNESKNMTPYNKYFDFDMLNKHFNEQIEFLSGILWLAIYVFLVYTFVRIFLHYDN